MTEPILPFNLMQRYQVAALGQDKDTLILGITDITNQSAVAAISFHTGLKVHPVTISHNHLHQLLQQASNKDNILDSQLNTTLSKIKIDEEKPSDTDKTDEPVAEFVNTLLSDAIHKNISDIHIEPYETFCRIRYRCDGILHEAAHIPLYLLERITTRLKIMAKINIAESRLPQDGRIPLRSTKKIELRISTCPTLFGEKIVLRILNNQSTTLSMDALGLTEQQKMLFLDKLHEPQGLILVTGPTGSGKTITLYSALNYLNHVNKNILSIEDPVEIELPGINQINTNSKIGLHFATALRASLRQDPDVIMVGEIRDLETAKIAMQAAQTGHLVLSTLHTNSAAETMNRLQVMGVDNYHLISSLSLIIAQRLVRKRCKLCQNGCEHCHQGYSGRLGLFELLPITKDIIHLITHHATTEEILQHCKQTGWPFMRDIGLQRVAEGITTYDELNRVLTD